MSDEIRVEVRRDRGDYFSAIYANYWHSGGFWWMAGGAIFFAVVTAAFEVSQGEPQPWAAALATAGFFLALVIPLNLLTIILTARQSWKQPGARDTITYVFTRESLSVSAAIGSGVTKWSVYRRAFENGRVLVLRHHVNIMHLLPTRDIPPDTLVSLRRLLRDVLDGRVSFKGKLDT